MNNRNNTSWWTDNKIVVLSLVGIMVLSAPIAIPALLHWLVPDAHIMCKAEQYYTSFIALCTTFVVGFQIYNTLEWKERFKELEADKNEIGRKIKELEVAKLECKYYNSYTIGKIHFAASQNTYNFSKVNFVSSRYCWNTARAFSFALLYASLDGHNIGDSFENFGELLEKCIEQIKKIHANVNPGNISIDDFQALNNGDFPSYFTRRSIIRTVDKNLTDACVNLRSRGDYESVAEKIERLSSIWKNLAALYYPDVI